LGDFPTLAADEVPPAVTVVPKLDVPVPPGTELPGIAGYETLEVLGRGGMGVVYLAWQPALSRLVALKMVLAGAHAGPEHRARFRTEAEAAARLHHPNIIQIYEVGEAGGQPYLVMEYVSGGSLAACLRGKPQPWRAACELVATLAGAVQHAHQRGIVHRDLKPENILLQNLEARGQKSEARDQKSNTDLRPLISDLSPKITDFGLAKLVIGGVNQTTDGAILGTPGYMAPEQAGGSSQFPTYEGGEQESVGPAADIHALGAILYELLTGRPPYRAAGIMETLEQLCSQEPVSPRRLVANVPRDLETICLKCLQKEPGKRYESALALADDLHRCVAGEPVHARPLSTLERSVKWVRRHPARAALLAVSCLAALALTAVAVGLSYNARLQSLNGDLHNAVEKAEAAQSEAERQRDALDKLKRWVLYLRDVQLAEDAWYNGQVRRMPALLDGCPPDLRGWEWYYLNGLSHVVDEFLNHPTAVHTVAFDPRGRRLASGCQDGSLWLWDIGSRNGQRAAEQHSASIRCVAFSPDGHLLASAGDDGLVRLCNPDDGKLLRTLKKHRGALRCLTFSPDGKTLAVAGKEQRITLYDPDTGDKLRTLPGHVGGVLALAFSPDGRRLASGGADHNIRLWDPDRGTEVQVLEGHTEDVHGVAFRSDGMLLASVSGDGTLRTWDTTNGQSTVHYPPRRTALYGVAFASQGRIVTGGENHVVYLWGDSQFQLIGRQGNRIESVAVSPDGRYIASASTDWTVRLSELDVPREYRALPTGNDRVLAAKFMPERRRLVDVAVGGTVREWDVETGKMVKQMSADLDTLRSVALSADGRLLAATGRNGSIRCYDLLSGKPVCGDQTHGDNLRVVTFSPDCFYLASADDDGTVKVWDLLADRLLFTCKHDGPVLAMAFSPVGRILASGGPDGVRLWDAQTGQALGASPQDTQRVTALAFGPDGRLVIGQMRGDLTLWDPETGQRSGNLVGHTSAIWSLAFTPDGKRLASGGRDMTVKLWDTASGQQVLTLRGFTSEVSTVAFSGDGSRLVTTDLSGSVRLWEAEHPK
jgi:WD40 repeat protein/serine/threonine protein kinase